MFLSAKNLVAIFSCQSLPLGTNVPNANYDNLLFNCSIFPVALYIQLHTLLITYAQLTIQLLSMCGLRYKLIF